MDPSQFEITDRRKTAVEIVIDTIKTLLIEKKLRPGDMIPSESVLAENLKTGRGSIREAMKILSAHGIIEIRRGEGTFICTSSNPKIFDPPLFSILVSDFDYRELIDIRDIMERGIIRLIIDNATDDELQKLERLMARMDRLAELHETERAAWDVIDIEYHYVMGRITHNKIVENMYEYLIELFAPTINALRGYLAHRNLHEAIVARDPERAFAMLQKHTDTWKEIYFEQQPKQESPAGSDRSPDSA